MPIKKHKYLIGIDVGLKTGVCIYSCFDKRIRQVATVKIHQAMKMIEYWHMNNIDNVFVRVEDARKRKWFGLAGKEQLQGAGSIKRDSKIWEDFLTDLKIPFEMVAPKNNSTKLSAEAFKKITGYAGVTSEHARDSCMLVYGF